MADPNETELNTEEFSSPEVAEMASELVSDLGFGKEDDGADPSAVVDDQAAAGGKPPASTSKPPATGTPAPDASAKAENDGKAPSAAAPSTTSTETAEPPKAWTKDLAEWNTLPQTVKDQIHKREADIQKGFESLRGLAGFGDAFVKSLGPILPTLQQFNLDPAQHAANLMNIHKELALGDPAKKAQIIRGLMQEFGVTDEHLSGAQPVERAYVDPQVEQLTSRLNSLESGNRERQLNELTDQVRAFSADPKNKYFDQVAPTIVELLQSKACSTLQQAYDTACAMNPTVISAITQEKVDAQLKADADKRAEAARKAKQSTAANLRVTTKARGTLPATGSMEDTLRATAEKLFGD